jgi:hypothetical protein
MLDTSMISILFSGIALIISAISLFWSVRSFYVSPKPRVEISLSQKHSGGLAGPKTGSALIMHVVNHGPGKLVISDILRSVWIKMPKDGRGSDSIHLNLFSGQGNEPFSGATENDLPIKLDVGDKVTFFYADYTLMKFPEHFERTQIGVIDTWGRAHTPRHSELQDCLSNIYGVWKKREETRQSERLTKSDAMNVGEMPTTTSTS